MVIKDLKDVICFPELDCSKEEAELAVKILDKLIK